MDASVPARARVASARDEILTALRERIVAFAASRLSRDVAEDLAQEVLLVVHEKYAGVDRLDELLPLCFKIVRFKMLSLVRKSVRRGERDQVPIETAPVTDGRESPEALAARNELTERLVRVIREMGPRCRELLRLKLAGKTFAEIQTVMGVKSINTIYTWDFRCRKQALESLGGHWERLS